MSYLSFENVNLEEIISVDMSLRQAIHIMSLLAFHFESGLSVDEEDMMSLYEDLFSLIQPFGNIQE